MIIALKLVLFESGMQITVFLSQLVIFLLANVDSDNKKGILSFRIPLFCDVFNYVVN
jgi:hypothetical protein